MTKYAYVATAPDGQVAKGTTKADSREDAELALYERELRDIRVTEKRGFLQLEVTKRRVKREEVMHLSRHLAALIEDGLRGGDKLSDCFDRHPKIFPEFYRGILRSAELSGQLDSVLSQLAKYLERDLEARRKVKQAMIYPSVVALLSVVTVVVLASFVLPRFKEFFASLHATLPLPTRMLLAVTDFLGAWWWALAIGLGSLALLIFAVTRTRRGRYARDRLFLAVPVLGGTIQFALVERFCRILSSMVSAGVQLPRRCGWPPDRCRTWSSAARSARPARRCWRVPGWPGRWPRPGCSRPPRPR